MFKEILKELKHHAPFTTLGAPSGILVMLLFRQIAIMGVIFAYFKPETKILRNHEPGRGSIMVSIYVHFCFPVLSCMASLLRKRYCFPSFVCERV